MKEYEYILMGIEEYLSHYNSMAICVENYTGINFPNGFDEFFDKYVEMSNRYKSVVSKMGNDISFEEKCFFSVKRENDFKLFVNSICDMQKMSSVDVNININGVIKEYIDVIIGLKGCTLEDDLLLYPFIINKLRDGEENGDVCQ